MAHEVIFSLPVETKVLFSNHKGIYKAGVEKRQRSFVTKLSFIKPFLTTGENILLVTTGRSPMTTLAQRLYGLLFPFLKRSLFVFTNKRVFVIPSRMNYAYRQSIAHLPYSDIRELSARGRKLIITCTLCGQEKTLLGLGRREAKKLKELAKTWALAEPISDCTELTHLCPSCTEELPENAEICRKCKQTFKTSRKARLLSIIPGGGYFYMGHHALGVFTLLIEIALLTAIGLFGYQLSQGLSQLPTIMSLAGCVLAYALVKASSVYHSSLFAGEFIPAKHVEVKIRVEKKEKQVYES